MKKRRLPPLAGSTGLVLSLVLAAPTLTAAPATTPPAADRAKLLAAAREIMQGQTYCALITTDEAGHPQVRTMNPFVNDPVTWQTPAIDLVAPVNH